MKYKCTTDAQYFRTKSKYLGAHIHRLERIVGKLRDKLAEKHRRNRLTYEEWSAQEDAKANWLTNKTRREAIQRHLRQWRQQAYDCMEETPHFAFWLLGACDGVKRILWADSEELQSETLTLTVTGENLRDENADAYGYTDVMQAMAKGWFKEITMPEVWKYGVKILWLGIFAGWLMHSCWAVLL